MRRILVAGLLAAAASRAVAQDAVVRGTAVFRGEAPKPREYEPEPGLVVVDESVLVDAKTGGLANVFVWVSGGDKLPKPADPKKQFIEMRDRQFRPRVVAVQPRQTLVVLNNDDHSHGLHVAPRKSPEKSGPLNVVGEKGDLFEMTFLAPELAIPVTIHGSCAWMRAWIFVLDHTYFAVSGAKGEFALPALPPGEYELSAWHEVYGRLPDRKVTLKGDEFQLEFVFEKGKK